MQVDVVIPTRNRPDLTAQAVGSVLAQTHAGCRAIVVDDGSETETLQAIRSLAGERVTVVERRCSGGPQRARQTGYEASTAEYVASLDSDDLWEPLKIARQIALLDDRADLDVAICWHVWEAHGVVEKERRVDADGRIAPLTTDNMSTPLFRRSALEGVGGFLPSDVRQMLPGSEHIEFWMRVSATCRVGAVPQVMVRCRSHEGGRESDALDRGESADSLAYVAKRHAEHLAEHPADRAELWQRIGARYLAVGDRRTGLRWMARGLTSGGPCAGGRALRRYGLFVAKSVVRPPD